MHAPYSTLASFSPFCHILCVLGALLLLRSAVLHDVVDVRRLDEELALEEFEYLVKRDDGQADVQHGLPLVPVERHDAEETLQEGHVEERKVQGHGQTDGVDEHHVLPQG
jgi:hypothetical protein